jgi:hypothetical protein
MEKLRELICRKGSQYFGSGGFSAGWRVIEGEVEVFPIAGTYKDNGFRRVQSYLLRPRTPFAVVEVWDGDGISRSGYRPLGKNGIYVLVQDERTELPTLCPECGHVIPLDEQTEVPLLCRECGHAVPLDVSRGQKG